MSEDRKPEKKEDESIPMSTSKDSPGEATLLPGADNSTNSKHIPNKKDLVLNTGFLQSSGKKDLVLDTGPVLLFPELSASDSQEFQLTAVEDLMKVTNGITNLVLAHEIAVNPTFRIEKQDTTGTLEHIVRTNMEKAFWDIIRGELMATPPEYDKAVAVILDAKKALLEIVSPNQKNLLSVIEEGLDEVLIKQQAENGNLDLWSFVKVFVHFLKILCAPARDKFVNDILIETDLHVAFQKIFDVITYTRIDLVNYAVTVTRKQIASQIVNYEREKFMKFINAPLNKDELPFTKSWLIRHIPNEEEQKKIIDTCASSEGQERRSLGITLLNAFVELLTWDPEQPLPETLLLDENRYRKVTFQIVQLSVICSIMSMMPAQLESDKRVELLKNLSILLTVEECKRQSSLTTALTNVTEQVISVVKTDMEEKNIALKTPYEVLRSQMTALESPTNSVRTLFSMRIKQYIMDSMTMFEGAPVAKEKIPIGCSDVKSQLEDLKITYIALVVHNKDVFSDYYKSIIQVKMPAIFHITTT